MVGVAQAVVIHTYQLLALICGQPYREFRPSPSVELASLTAVFLTL
jgi:hypothetical protein